MRTLVDLPEENLRRLTELSRERKVSRAHLVRCAVERYLEQEEPDETGQSALNAIFGIWADRGIDALEYQDRARKEWEREF